MARTTIDLSTRDGICKTSLFRPDSGSGPWPGVLFFMDGVGPREALFEMAERIAQRGYVVALPDLFYRVGTYEPRKLWRLMFDPVTRKQWETRFYDSAMDVEHFMIDAEAVLDFLETEPDVADCRVGATGYGMGGTLALRAAGTFPECIGAAASFHGGELASDDAESPHHLAPRMKAQIYVAGAIDDPTFPFRMKQRLETALRHAEVNHMIETYACAKNGWTIPDHPAFDAPLAERHWRALFALFDGALGPPMTTTKTSPSARQHAAR
ncbi:Dienelactone hydrolase family [Labilithrix luteola]|uniref:Dienelactone hydrolase family n=1 Tax=Labilithrix luteola TaxID=1391654 RepID=A0A0K1QA84_9BACT|nr:dienelactone hydrolase family protein [Labilithrix luteola]AKV02643.1 Dienelactone hydrolase family [Labilithrix luteola]